MLLLDRYVGEKIVIDHPVHGPIVLTVTRTGDDCRGRRACWIGVEAPREVPVVRTELLKRRQAEAAGKEGD